MLQINIAMSIDYIKKLLRGSSQVKIFENSFFFDINTMYFMYYQSHKPKFETIAEFYIVFHFLILNNFSKLLKKMDKISISVSVFSYYFPGRAFSKKKIIFSILNYFSLERLKYNSHK